MCFTQTLANAGTVSVILASIDISELDLSDLENNLSNESTPLKFENNTRIIPEKLHDAIHFGSTSILLINMEKYLKMNHT